MGHYRSEMMGEADRNEDARFSEALAIRRRLEDVPMSRLTWGEATFLQKLFEFKYSHSVNEQDFARLSEIARRVLPAEVKDVDLSESTGPRVSER